MSQDRLCRTLRRTKSKERTKESSSRRRSREGGREQGRERGERGKERETDRQTDREKQTDRQTESFTATVLQRQVADEETMNQKMRTQTIRTDCRLVVSLGLSRGFQSEAKRSQFESVSLERSLRQNNCIEPAIQSSERARKCELIQQ